MIGCVSTSEETELEDRGAPSPTVARTRKAPAYRLSPRPPCHNRHTQNQLSIKDQDVSRSNALGDGKSSERTLPPLPVSLRDDQEALAHYFKVKPAFPELIEAGIRQCLGDYEKQLPLQVNS